MRRVKLRFAGLTVDFVNEERALDQLREVAKKGTYLVYVVYEPECCGKTALLRQLSGILVGYGYEVAYVNPLARVYEERLTPYN
jgi:AAA+ ATPase superfamily predicted ATPase